MVSLGFSHTVHSGLVKEFDLKINTRGNPVVDNFQTSVSNVFAAGDMVTGQSLIVNAIESGREMADAIDKSISGTGYL